ncbi:hypothetical protein C8Q74DRAFT_1370834 [Fomes fomentarius]|nr:hypothetical protein C8Q74DRAFT_1370834 [Fomes fomentarius]
MVVHTLLFALLAPLSAFVGAQNTPPPVIVPRSGDLWTSGERQTVRWSIDGINVYSPSLQPLRGTLYLGHIINETSQYIWIHQPLASNFTYLQMQADIIVPAVPTAKNYFIVWQSDNWSSFFTINNPADLQGTGSVGVNITVTTVSQTASASSLSTSESVSAPVTNSSSSAVSTSASATPPSTSPSPTSSSTSSTSSSENATATGSNDVGKKMPVSVIFGAGCIILMAMFTA